MPTYELLITDITQYGTSLYCVAGWDLNRHKMIRPEPATARADDEASRFWDAQWVAPGRVFQVGNVIQLEATKPPNDFPFPHATEDRIVDLSSISQKDVQMTLNDIAGIVRVSAAVEETFGGFLSITNSGKPYVPANTKTCSLDAIKIGAGEISFYEDNLNPKKPRLRVLIEKGGEEYDFSVPADAERRIYLANGVGALEKQRQYCGSIHVRLGLSRPFGDQKDRCYAQVNGLYFL